MTIAGAVLAAVAIGILVSGLVDFSAVQNAPSSTEWADLEGAYGRAPVLTGIGFGGIGLGLALGIGGVAWIATSDSSGPDASLGLRWGTTF